MAALLEEKKQERDELKILLQNHKPLHQRLRLATRGIERRRAVQILVSSNYQGSKRWRRFPQVSGLRGFATASTHKRGKSSILSTRSSSTAQTQREACPTKRLSRPQLRFQCRRQPALKLFRRFRGPDRPGWTPTRLRLRHWRALQAHPYWCTMLIGAGDVPILSQFATSGDACPRSMDTDVARDGEDAQPCLPVPPCTEYLPNSVSGAQCTPPIATSLLQPSRQCVPGALRIHGCIFTHCPLSGRCCAWHAL